MKALPVSCLALCALFAMTMAGCTPTEDAPDEPEERATYDTLTGDNPPEAANFARNFRAIGTNPYWAAHVTDGRMRYITPANQEGVTVDVTEQPAPDAPEGIALSGTLDEVAFSLTGRVEPCSDELSDREYPYSVVFKLGEETRNGCARPTDSL